MWWLNLVLRLVVISGIANTALASSPLSLPSLNLIKYTNSYFDAGSQEVTDRLYSLADGGDQASQYY